MPRCRLHLKVPTVKLGGMSVLYHHNLLNGPGIWFVHAKANGGVLPKTEVSWRNINGILIRTPRHQLFLHFRRLPSYPAKQ